MQLLNPGDHFPSITLTPVERDSLDLPGALAGHFAVVLFFRGSWCPYCNAQLRAFQRAQDKLDELGIEVVAISVDDEATTGALIAKHELGFPVGHSADAAAIRKATGAFVNPEPVHLQSTGFALDPDGNVIVSVYSNGAIGRLVPEDIVGLVKYLKSKQPRDRHRRHRRRARLLATRGRRALRGRASGLQPAGRARPMARGPRSPLPVAPAESARP